MSQAKVDRQKERKANVKKTLKKKKIYGIVRIVVLCIISAAIIAWLGYSGYDKYKEYKAANPTYVTVDTSAINNFSLSQDLSVDTEDSDTADTDSDSTEETSEDNTTESAE